ncbi:hypothetical protein, partial [Bartonella bovis]|uniref:hypothetical protein n=1 Tax=Bartonella bovis TaxID=155194 RepID=UPI001304A2BB
VYLCVVSTALVAGLALTSHTSKAYAQDQNCGRGVGVVSGNEPIVCGSGGKRTLNSSGGDINIDMDGGKGSEEAAVTVKGPGTNITIIKSLKVIKGRSGSQNLPVIKVLNKGQLTLDQEVDVKGVKGMQKVISVDGQGSSVTLNGKLTGFEGGEVKVSNEGMVVLGKGVEGIEGMKVGIDGGGTVRLMKDVAFDNDAEAGIQIKGSGAGKASVIGVGSSTTMTVNGTGADGVGIQMDGTGGTANVVMLKIVGSGAGSTGKGV